jgi:hypothetical protein
MSRSTTRQGHKSNWKKRDDAYRKQQRARWEKNQSRKHARALVDTICFYGVFW